MSTYGERPAFIDLVDAAGDDVGEGRIPRWFVVLAVTLFVAALYYLLSFWSGPRLSSPHNFVNGIQPSAEATAEP